MTLPAKVIILLQTTPNLPEKNASSPFKSTNPCLVMKKNQQKNFGSIEKSSIFAAEFAVTDSTLR